MFLIRSLIISREVFLVSEGHRNFSVVSCKADKNVAL